MHWFSCLFFFLTALGVGFPREHESILLGARTQHCHLHVTGSATQQHKRERGDGMATISSRSRTGLHGPGCKQCRQRGKTAWRRELWEWRYSQDPTLATETCPGSLQAACLKASQPAFFSSSVAQHSGSLYPLPVGAAGGVLAALASGSGKGRLFRSAAFLGAGIAFQTVPETSYGPYQQALGSTASSRSQQAPQPSPAVCGRRRQLASRLPSPPCLQPDGCDKDGGAGTRWLGAEQGTCPTLGRNGSVVGGGGLSRVCTKSMAKRGKNGAKKGVIALQ